MDYDARVRHAARLLAVCALAWAGCDDPPRTEIPLARVPRAATAPTLDGRLSEGVWASAARTEPFVDTMDGSEGAPRTHARLLWDDEHLYVAFEVDDPFLKCTFEGRDARLWEQDVVEIMVDPDGDGRNYFELQMSPTERIFDTRFDTPRRPPPIGHVGWDSRLRGAVDARGTPNDDAADDGYTAELALPFRALGVQAPRAGQTLRIALYVLDARPDGQRGVGWSAPLVGDFHVPDRFGRVELVP